jgi:uncharacterized repeat protein (TIGR02543 family)
MNTINKIIVISIIILIITITGCNIPDRSSSGDGDDDGGNDNNPTYYTVVYNGNNNTGGSVPVDSTNYEQGATVTVLGPGTLVRTGHSFIGWNTQADGLGTTYTQGQTFTMGTANVTLYAKWTTNPTYTVTYNGNGNTGGSTPVDSINYEQGATVTVLGAGTLVRTGHSFIGWNTQADGLGTTYTQGQTFTMGTANVTLYAKWTANPTFTVTYDGNGSTGGNAPVDGANYEQGQTVIVLGNSGSLVRTGYYFTGWNTRADGLGTTYTQGQTFTMGTADVTLYAKWTNHTVSYNGNGHTGGIVPTDGNTYVPGQTVTVLGNSGGLVKTGNALAGWNTQADGLGTTYRPGETFLMGTADVTLYAEWLVCTEGLQYTLINGDTEYSVTEGTVYTTGGVVIPAYWEGKPVTALGYKAFFRDMMTSVAIPNLVTTIGDYAFGDCDSLTSVAIPDSVTAIGDWAFEYCISLTSVIIGAAVTSIGDHAFYDCSNLATVNINATTPPTLGGSAVLDDNAAGRMIYVPSASVSAYQAAPYWDEYAGYIAAQ